MGPVSTSPGRSRSSCVSTRSTIPSKDYLRKCASTYVGNGSGESPIVATNSKIVQTSSSIIGLSSGNSALTHAKGAEAFLSKAGDPAALLDDNRGRRREASGDLSSVAGEMTARCAAGAQARKRRRTSEASALEESTKLRYPPASRSRTSARALLPRATSAFQR